MSPFPEPSEAPTEEELRAARTLVELADLIHLFGHRWLLRPLHDSLSWASRKPRSLPFRRRRRYHPLFPPPHPSPVVDKERGIGAAAARSSPTTPLSFQESGSEDVDAPPDEQLKRCEKWVKPEQEMMMGESLSNSMSNPGREPQQEKQPIGGGGDLFLVDPAASGQQRPATITMGPDWGRHGVQCPAKVEDQSVGGVMDHVGIPDLNVTPEEAATEDWVWGWEQQLVAYKAATSALARRRRRLLIQRKKRSIMIPLRK